MANTVQAYCPSCDGIKHQQKLFAKNSVEPITKADEEYAVLQCLGCHTLTFLLTVKQKGRVKPVQYVFPNDEGDGDYMYLDYEHKDQLPTQIAQLYDEIENAFDSDSAILAGIGLRTLVEAVCIDQKMPGANLLLKIRALHAKGLISSAELPILDKLRLIGNASAHEVKSLPMKKLELALSIINHVLRSIYILPKINKQLNLVTKKKSPKTTVS